MTIKNIFEKLFGIKTVLEIQMLKEFITRRPTLQEMLQEVLKAKYIHIDIHAYIYTYTHTR